MRTQEAASASAVTAPESRCHAYTHSPTPSNGRGKLPADVQKTTVRPSAEIPASVTVLFGGRPSSVGVAFTTRPLRRSSTRTMSPHQWSTWRACGVSPRMPPWKQLSGPGLTTCAEPRRRSYR